MSKQTNRTLKAAVRDRMNETGENYTTALRAVKADQQNKVFTAFGLYTDPDGQRYATSVTASDAAFAVDGALFVCASDNGWGEDEALDQLDIIAVVEGNHQVADVYTDGYSFGVPNTGQPHPDLDAGPAGTYTVLTTAGAFCVDDVTPVAAELTVLDYLDLDTAHGVIAAVIAGRHTELLSGRVTDLPASS
jgi:hypothetical protein